MKKYIITLMAALSLSVGANTNTVLTLEPSGGKSEAGSWEVTIGGGGTHIDGENFVGVDISVATNPFKARPEVWLGITQSAYWEPSFAGATDISAEWSFHLFDELYVNPGVFGGILYDKEGNHSWRYGPQVNFQYYFGNAFVYTGVNYDIVPNGPEGFRYGWGIGVSF